MKVRDCFAVAPRVRTRLLARRYRVLCETRSESCISAKGALSCQPGAALQESDYPQDNQALKARLNPAWLLNPRHIARRNQRRACEATRGIPPERCECDGVLVACQRIPGTASS